jgi:hypothetical protein
MANEFIIEKWNAEFEGWGADNVHRMLEEGKYFDKDRSAAARAWLAKKAREREEAAQAEQLAIARATKDAAVDSAASARRSADAAERSANTARSANVIAGIALIVSVIAALYAAWHGK